MKNIIKKLKTDKLQIICFMFYIFENKMWKMIMEKYKMKYSLQPLRLKAGWEIIFNNFTEYDINKHSEDDIIELNEDLLQLYHKNANLIIDLGWYPNNDKDGQYILLMIKNYDWDFPLEKVISKSKDEIIDCIEKWVDIGFFAKYNH